MSINEFCRQIETRGGDSNMYYAAYLAVPADWGPVYETPQPHMADRMHLVADMVEAGVVEQRSFEITRDNNSVCGVKNEYRRK